MADPLTPGESGGHASASGLALSLALFVVIGAAAALFLWWALNEILEGRHPPAYVWGIAGGALVVLLLLATGLARRLRRLDTGS